MPNSFGPFKGPGVKRIVKNTLKKCKFVSARETFTQEMVKRNLGIDIPVYPDLAFSLKRNTQFTKKIMCMKYHLPFNKSLVAITVRPYRFPNSAHPEDDYENYKKSIAEFSKWLFLHDYMPVFVEHTLAVNAHENDGQCIKEIIKRLEEGSYRCIQDSNLTCMDLKSIYRNCDFTIGTRFHSVIFSLSESTPSLAISYVGNKTTGIMHDIGLSKYVIKIDEISSSNLIEKFQDLIDNYDNNIKQINRYLEIIKKKRNDLCNSLRKA